MTSPYISPAQLDAAKTANYDRGYREGFEAAAARHPYGSDPRVGVLGQDGNGTREVASFSAPQRVSYSARAPQLGVFSWDEIAAEINAEAGVSVPNRGA